ncbi:hypothetical protein EDB19DRAFT_1098056 [Suillus lakei]|nr:hypothetical protein EDB19DRAFT_1098056 [Suillus lakei]
MAGGSVKASPAVPYPTICPAVSLSRQSLSHNPHSNYPRCHPHPPHWPSSLTLRPTTFHAARRAHRQHVIGCSFTAANCSRRYPADVIDRRCSTVLTCLYQHSQCNFFKFFSGAAAIPRYSCYHTLLQQVTDNSKCTTEYAAIILCWPAGAAPPLGRSRRPCLSSPPQMGSGCAGRAYHVRVPSAASLGHCVVHVACTIVALISRVIVYGCGYEYAR